MAAGLLALPAAAWAQARPQEAQAQQQARAAAAGAEEQRLAQQRVAAAARLSETEQAVADRSAELGTLAERRDAAAAQLARRAAAMAPLLPLMERLALYPAETLLAVPAPPEQALRGLAILRGLARTLEREAAALRDEQARLDAEQRAIDAALPRLRAAQAVQQAQASALDQQIIAARAARQQAEAAGAEAGRAAAAEAARADSLRAAVTALEAARRAPKPRRVTMPPAPTVSGRPPPPPRRASARTRSPRPLAPSAEPQGQHATPVAGTVVRHWGEATEAGPSNGVSYRPAPQARVVAPCAGRVRFAGPFRSYGALVIIDCGGGYAFVLAGLGRIDASVGASLLAGEPVGVMPTWDPAASGARPALYVELRRDGQAVNPAPFLRGRG